MGTHDNAKFLARLALASATLFIVISYIAKPTNNQCQMTFMMEPPKFIPIPIEESKPPAEHGHQRSSASDKRKQYALFMYSEYGFPMESDIRRDLKDSMPVLFVPGNAGSYQQVRSLASTCIRRQLQSLDAFKFIFYTIDFKAQLSGISGRLIHQQIPFVNSALRQISKMHSIDTNGVIVIGHSVGGFIAKALFARDYFDHNLVPLLINLASPLTKPFINFDDEMRELFVATHHHWSRRSNETLSISISGGKSDRLVPMHLSLDSQYDLALTTNSIKDVWLTADHVSITWCRELMNKLAQLLSALMDRKHTRLILDKNQALGVLKDQLQTNGVSLSNSVDTQRIPTRRIISSAVEHEFAHYRSIKRNELLESNIMLKLNASKSGTLFIWLEHIGALRENALHACEELLLNNEHSSCEGKLDLLGIAQTVPSRRFEPRRNVIVLKNASSRFKYISIEFATRSKNDAQRSQVPESMSLQVISKLDVQDLSIPTLPEYLFRKVLYPGSLKHGIAVSDKLPIIYSKLRLENLHQLHQFYSLIIEAESCKSGDRPSETIASLLQGEKLSESFHPDKVTSTVIVKLNSQKTVLTGKTDKSEVEEMYLDLFLDGTCENFIRIQFDWWSFIETMIQQRSSEILACSIYCAYASIVVQLLRYSDQNLQVEESKHPRWSCLYWTAGVILAYGASAADLGSIMYATDHVVIFTSILTLAVGFTQMIEFFIIRRMIDLGIIAYKSITLIRNFVSPHGRPSRQGMTNGASNRTKNGRQTYNRKVRKIFGVDIEWLIINLAVIGSTVLSAALMRICMLFIVMILQLRLATVAADDDRDGNDRNEHLRKTREDLDVRSEQERNKILHCLFVSIAVLCTISLIGDIPALLLRINPLDLNVDGNIFDLNFISATTSLALIKIICDHIESLRLENDLAKTSSYPLLRPLTYVPKHSHILALIPMSAIALNIRNIDFVESTIIIWAAGNLLKSNIGRRG